MAREWAKKFYKSLAWANCRDVVLHRDNFICQICGQGAEVVHHIKYLTPENINDPSISLNPNNLLSLCNECHAAIHRQTDNFAKGGSHKRRNKFNGVWFNEHGDMVNTNVYLIWGSPCSGKNRYVNEHKQQGDIVVDVDSIISAITQEDSRKHVNDDVFRMAMDIVETMYNSIENRNIECKNVWVIGCFPKRKEREELIKRLRANEIFIESNIYECIERARNDNTRNDKQFTYKIIEQWFYLFNKYNL